jgi:hypothetical protein
MKILFHRHSLRFPTLNAAKIYIFSYVICSSTVFSKIFRLAVAAVADKKLSNSTLYSESRHDRKFCAESGNISRQLDK